MLVEFSPHPFSEGLRAELIKWSLIIGPFALVIGVVTLVHTHVIRIKRRVEHWQYSYLVFIGMIVMVAFGLPMAPKNGGNELPKWLEWFKWFKGRRTKYSYGFSKYKCRWKQRCFPCSHSSLRPPRIARSAPARWKPHFYSPPQLIVMIGNAPIGDYLWNELSPVGENIPSTARQWILDNPNLSSRRGIILGVSLGVISQSIRIIFGIERSYLGGGD